MIVIIDIFIDFDVFTQKMMKISGIIEIGATYLKIIRRIIENIRKVSIML